MTLLHILSYVGIIAGFAFVVLSLASGLLWISEVIEEHSRLAKCVGIRAIYAIIALQILLYFVDSLPLLHSIFAIFCNIVYLQNFSTSWPLISLTSASFVASCVLSIANHFLWFFYFSRRTQEARHYAHRGYGNPQNPSSNAPGFADIATFFAICVWLVPLFLFLSLSANDNTLPVSSGGAQMSPTAMVTPATPVTTSRSSLFKSIIDIFPRVRRRNTSEGIILSHTPNPSAPSTPYATSFGQSTYSPGRPSSPAPPHSPLQPYSLSDTALPHGQNSNRRGSLTLRPPPKRNSTGPAQRVRVSDSVHRRSLEPRENGDSPDSTGSDEPVEKREHGRFSSIQPTSGCQEDTFDLSAEDAEHGRKLYNTDIRVTMSPSLAPQTTEIDHAPFFRRIRLIRSNPVESGESPFSLGLEDHNATTAPYTLRVPSQSDDSPPVIRRRPTPE